MAAYFLFLLPRRAPLRTRPGSLLGRGRSAPRPEWTRQGQEGSDQMWAGVASGKGRHKELQCRPRPGHARHQACPQLGHHRAVWKSSGEPRDT